MLFDRYAPLLTEKQQSAFSLYFNEDLSLSEIAEHTQTSRQAVRSLLAKTEKELRHFEDVLGLCGKEARISALIEPLIGKAKDADTLRSILSIVKE